MEAKRRIDSFIIGPVGGTAVGKILSNFRVHLLRACTRNPDQMVRGYTVEITIKIRTLERTPLILGLPRLGERDPSTAELIRSANQLLRSGRQT